METLHRWLWLLRFSIVVWAVAAWYFGIPTSESHALIAGLTGSAMALGGFGCSQWLGMDQSACWSSCFYRYGLWRRLFDCQIVVKARLCLEEKPTNFYSRASLLVQELMLFTWCARWAKFMGVFMLVLL